MIARLIPIEEPTLGTLTERLISFDNNFRPFESWCILKALWTVKFCIKLMEKEVEKLLKE